MGATTIAVGTAVAVGKALIGHADFGCEVLIHNRTKHCLLHDEYYAAHGGLSPSGELPAIPAAVDVADSDYPQTDGFYFPQVVAIYGKRAPAVVMQWKFAGMPLFLFVFAYLGGIGQDNAGFFQLRPTEIDDLQAWWSTKVEKNKTWFYHGDMKNLTHTVDGVIISGDLDNANTATFNVYLDEA
jgi:hypothetical protein